MYVKSILFCLLFLTICFSVRSYGSVTPGKIAGFVYDAATREPIPNAKVELPNTHQTVKTDSAGYYCLTSISTDFNEVSASAKDYQTTKKTDISIHANRTTTVNFTLLKNEIPQDDATYEAAIVSVQMKAPNSVLAFDQKNISTGPYHDLFQLMKAQVGIASFGTNAARPRFRGTEYHDASILVDGIRLEDVFGNEPYFRINLSSIQDMQIVSGGFEAEHGNIHSGLVNVKTKAGKNIPAVWNIDTVLRD